MRKSRDQILGPWIRQWILRYITKSISNKMKVDKFYFIKKAFVYQKITKKTKRPLTK